MYRGKVRETFGLEELSKELHKIQQLGWKKIDTGKYKVDGPFVTSDNHLIGILSSSEHLSLLSVLEFKTETNRFIERTFYGYTIS